MTVFEKNLYSAHAWASDVADEHDADSAMLEYSKRLIVACGVNQLQDDAAVEALKKTYAQEYAQASPEAQMPTPAYYDQALELASHLALCAEEELDMPAALEYIVLPASVAADLKKTA